MMQRRSAQTTAGAKRGNANIASHHQPPSQLSQSKIHRPSRSRCSGLTMGSLFLAMLLGGVMLLYSHVNKSFMNRLPKEQQRQFSANMRNGKPNIADTAAVDRAVEQANDVGITSGNVEYHVVFSTGCSLYQDWQSYVFFFQAMVAKQPGTVTRIVSGCDDEDQVKMSDLFEEQIHPMAPGRFKIHFTPDYSRLPNGKSFVYWNKPFGMRHWLENALGHPGKPVNENAIVILMDPDQLIMRPFTNNDFSNTKWKFIARNETPYTRIEHGKPMGQYYGFALQWLDKVNVTMLAANSPIHSLSRDEARAGYILGPPYIATARDMYTIVRQWSDFAKPVYEMYPYLLAEMFAYCLGAAHVQLPHQTAASFMISDVFTGNMEGWMYIDKIPNNKTCSGYSVDDLPNVLHFCQRYGLGKFFFGKRKLPKDFLTCESPLLMEPPNDLLDRYDYAIFPGPKKREWDAAVKKRNTFVICYLLPALNAAAFYYKEKHCNMETANLEKSLIFFESLDMTTMK